MLCSRRGLKSANDNVQITAQTLQVTGYVLKNRCELRVTRCRLKNYYRFQVTSCKFEEKQITEKTGYKLQVTSSNSKIFVPMLIYIFNEFVNLRAQVFVGFDEGFEKAGHILMCILHHI